MAMRVECTHDERTWQAASALTRLKERDRVRRGGKSALRHNNGMHPTAKGVAFIRKTPCLMRLCAAGDAGRYVSASRVIQEASRRASVVRLKS